MLKQTLEREQLVLQRAQLTVQLDVFFSQLLHVTGALLQYLSIFGATLAHRLVVFLATSPIVAVSRHRRRRRRCRARVVITVGERRVRVERAALH